MTRGARLFVGVVIASGAAIAAWICASGVPIRSEWLTLLVLGTLAALAQSFEVEDPGSQWYCPDLAFLFAGLLLLSPASFVLLVVLPRLACWARKLLTGSAQLGDWPPQAFNMASHILAGTLSRVVGSALSDGYDPLSTVGALATVAAAIVYVEASHLTFAARLRLSGDASIRRPGFRRADSLGLELVQMAIGYASAILWRIQPWLILPLLAPLAVVYRALSIPRLKQEARTDEKTGLLNVRRFRELFGTELKRAQGFRRPLSVIMADLDLLREINNRYGHLAGDAVLAGVGRIIRDAVRDYDIAARFGGEEFCIVLPESDLDQARVFAERLRQAVESASFSCSTSPESLSATLSFGVAVYPSEGDSMEELLHQADLALYQAKLTGRNRVALASDVPRSVAFAEVAEIKELLFGDYLQRFASGASQELQTLDYRYDDFLEDVVKRGVRRKPILQSRGAPAVLRAFVALTSAAAVVALAYSLRDLGLTDFLGLTLFTGLAILAEALRSDTDQENTVSVSIASAFGAAMLLGLPGAVTVSVAIAVVHHVRARPAWHMTALSWASQSLACAAPALLIHLQGFPSRSVDILTMLLVSLGAGVLCYLVNTGLLAAGISLRSGTRLLSTWRDQFRWMAGQYLVLCCLGVSLALVYTALGPLAALIFLFPVLLVRLTEKHAAEQGSASVKEVKRLNLELEKANEQVLRASQALGNLRDELFVTMSQFIDAHDRSVYGHSRRVAKYARRIARQMGLKEEQVERVRQAALLHDIGKIGLTHEILAKPGSLTPEEYAHVTRHPILGGELLATSQLVRHLAPFVRHHHERWDGLGYPDGLAGELCPLESRILAVSDTVEAMSADRPYAPAKPLAMILAELHKGSGTQFDPSVVEAFAAVAAREGESLLARPTRDELAGWEAGRAAVAEPYHVERPVAGKLQPSRA